MVLESSPKNILIVDDDKGLLRLWSRVLSREGFTVTLAANGGEAITKLKDNLYSVIFTDFYMPGIGGMELLKYCRSNHIASCVNILTGEATVGGAVECIRQGACDYIAKPFTIEEMVALSYKCMQHNTQREEIQSLKKSIVKLEELDRFKSDLVSNVSHELRTPLFSLGAAVDLLLEDLAEKIGEKSQATAQIIQSNILRLNTIVSNILTFSRIENGMLKPKFLKMDVAALVKEAFLNLSPLISKQGLFWEMEPSANQTEKVEIDGDSDQLHQVLINLIGNAIKFTRSGGKVGCRIVREEDAITLCIWDTGRGISPDNLTRVFERFYQEDASSTREVPGTGIGLAIVRSIVEMHGGKPWFESELGKGTQCYLRLPVHQSRVQHEVAA